MNPWSKQPGESTRWFSRFERFRLMGPTRTLRECVNAERVTKGHEKAPNTPTSWREAAIKWHWVARAQDWDMQVIEDDRAAWEKRREEWRAREFELSSSLAKKAAEMLVFPVARVVRNEDGHTTIIEPAEWRMGDAAKLADTASKLARLAAGLVTERKDDFKWNYRDCTPEQLERIANGEDPRSVLAGHKQGDSGARLAEDQAEDELA